MARERVEKWIKQHYPKPTVDPEWLNACFNWINDEFHLDPFVQIDEIIHHIEIQLLQSDLADSMLQGTGFPANVNTLVHSHIGAPGPQSGPILCQINSITEIGHSAFTLQNIRQARIDKADLAGLAGDETQGDGEDYKIPKYPSSMMQFDLSDGSTTLKAIEFKRLPGLELGETKLGYKVVILLKNVLIRDGIAFLEPETIELKGYQTEEIEAQRDAIFVSGLCLRLGQTLEESENQHQNARESRLSTPHREPFQDIDEMPRQPSDILDEPRRRHRRHQSQGVVVVPSQALSREISLTQVPSVTMAAGDDDYDYNDSVEMDDAFLQDLERVEREAQDRRSRGDLIEDQAQVVTLSRPVASSIRVGTSNTHANMEIITIEEDSDEADKENIAPVVSRRVRRRVDPGLEIIDISD